MEATVAVLPALVAVEGTVFVALVIILFVGAVAWINGANDVSKGVATLVGSRLADYRQGLAWGAMWTVLGGLAALVASAGLVRTFSTALVGASVARSELFPMAVAVGAFGWILIATRTGLPVSTTHSLTGAIAGTAVAAAGVESVQWSLLAATVILPLALSPFVAGAFAYFTHVVAMAPLTGASRYCVCVSERRIVAVTDLRSASAAVSSTLVLPLVVVGEERGCQEEEAIAGVRLTDAAHWATSAALSFARGLNDTPKIVALAIVAAGSIGVATGWAFAAGALLIGAGSYLSGRRVTATLAERVTDIDPLEGLVASGVAAGLVLLASFVALPVSTTHVASGAIVGAGLRSGWQAVHWNTVRHMVAAWFITLPVSAAGAALTWQTVTLMAG